MWWLPVTCTMAHMSGLQRCSRSLFPVLYSPYHNSYTMYKQHRGQQSTTQPGPIKRAIRKLFGVARRPRSRQGALRSGSATIFYPSEEHEARGRPETRSDGPDALEEQGPKRPHKSEDPPKGDIQNPCSGQELGSRSLRIVCCRRRIAVNRG